MGFWFNTCQLVLTGKRLRLLVRWPVRNEVAALMVRERFSRLPAVVAYYGSKETAHRIPAGVSIMGLPCL